MKINTTGDIRFGNKTALPTASVLELRLAAIEGDLAVIRGILKNILEHPLARDDFAPECPSEKDNGESIV